ACATAISSRLRTISRADQNRSPLTEEDARSLAVSLDSLGARAESWIDSVFISAPSRSAWPRAAAASLLRLSARHVRVAVSAKAVALCRSRVRVTRLPLTASTCWRKLLILLRAKIAAAAAMAKIKIPEI